MKRTEILIIILSTIISIVIIDSYNQTKNNDSITYPNIPIDSPTTIAEDDVNAKEFQII